MQILNFPLLQQILDRLNIDLLPEYLDFFTVNLSVIKSIQLLIDFGVYLFICGFIFVGAFVLFTLSVYTAISSLRGPYAIFKSKNKGGYIKLEDSDSMDDVGGKKDKGSKTPKGPKNPKGPKKPKGGE